MMRYLIDLKVYLACFHLLEHVLCISQIALFTGFSLLSLEQKGRGDYLVVANLGGLRRINGG